MPGADRHPSSTHRPVALETIIGAHLDRILSSGVFKGTDTLRQLLRFTVHETMAGRGGELKEYLLGVTVLGKGDSFDPKADPIVRVQMRRLRERLGRYYASEGRNDTVIIDIPKGTYVSTFRRSTRDGLIAEPVDMEETLIVGRQKELTDLRAGFDSAAAGHGRLFCLSGEAGIGKTMVVETFLRELAKSGVGYCLARGRCSERLAGSEAYLPWLEALESLLRGSDESVSHVMSMVAPAWCAQIAPLTQTSTADRSVAESTVASQERLKRELVTLLEELACRQPVVIVLDDLHWADASTIDILAYAAVRCTSQQVLIVGTYRPADLRATNHPFLRVKLELQGHGVCRESSMAFLTRGDVDRYLALRFQAHLFPLELSARIHDRTEGNPLFMTDLVRFLRDRGVFAQHDGRWVVVGQLSDVEKELPESVRSMVEKKIGQLSKADHSLLAAASVQGYEFDSAVLSRALQVDATEVEERLDVLEHVHGFVRLAHEQQFPDRTLTLRYRFVHVLYQNALYASLRPTRRVSLSTAVGEALLGYFDNQRSAIASELAMLFEAARDFRRAAEYFLLAAEQAARLSANKEAVVLARRGLDAINMQPETAERAQQELRLQTTLGPALMSTVGFGTPEAEAVYIRASELCQRAGETPQLFPVLWGLYQYWLARAEYKTCAELGEQMLALAQKVQDPTLLMQAYHSLGNTFCFAGDFELARMNSEQEMTFYVVEQHHSLASLYGGYDPGVACRSGLATNLWLLGFPDQALLRSHEGISLARDLAHTSSIGLALLFGATVRQFCRDARGTCEQAEAAIAIATQELSPWLAWGMVLRGWALAEQGQTEEGIAQLCQGIAGWRAAGIRCLEPYFLSLLVEAYMRTGQEEEALTTLAEALAVTEQTREGYVEAELYRLKGELLGPAEAKACFHQAIEIARRQKAKSFELRAVVSLSRVLQKEGRQAEAREILADIYSWFTEGFNTADLNEASALLEDLGVELRDEVLRRKPLRMKKGEL
jgi:predicted ATPase